MGMSFVALTQLTMGVSERPEVTGRTFDERIDQVRNCGMVVGQDWCLRSDDRWDCFIVNAGWTFHCPVLFSSHAYISVWDNVRG